VLRWCSSVSCAEMCLPENGGALEPKPGSPIKLELELPGVIRTLALKTPGGSSMTTHAVKLKVSANVPTDCSFWLEDDGWNGVCEELSITVRGSSFEDAKRKMEAALQAHIESVLSQHSRASRKKVA
jgi:predicted RNase H-like HicB family nuclease